MDETYLGGKRHGKRGRGAEGKTIVAGMVERKGRAVAKKVEDVKAETLTNLAKTYIDPSSILYTDELPSYNRVYREGYVGKRVYHKDKEYARFPGVHTNTVEGFWGLVKGGIRGVYHHVSPEYAESYFNEYAFRYSHRNDETPMFHLFLGRLVTDANLQDA
jgi:transposase